MTPENKPRRIQKLPPQLSNQIAAGEVIERPASVLKELLENSIDAGCTQIDITLEKGGLSLIQVQDNGSGICKEDLALALAQHATSKIHTFEDLEAVSSLGFRGEALASIASVSKLSLTSWIKGQETGWTILTGGREGEIKLKPSPSIQGTLVSVRDLFYNTPARRKFMRSEKTEFLHLEETFKRIALSQPKIEFTLKQGEKIIRRLPAAKRNEESQHRIALLCGQSFVKEARYISTEINGLKLEGWLGSKDQLRAQNDLQYFYVNGRIIRDKVVNHALRQAYLPWCPQGRYPTFILFLEIDHDAVDVNVHPTKHEVRFREARSVHDFLIYSVQEGLKELAQPDQKEFWPDQKTLPLAFEPPRNIEYSHREPEQPRDAEQIPTIEHSKGGQIFGKPLALLESELLLLENSKGWLMIDIKSTIRAYLHAHLNQHYQHDQVPQRSLIIPISVNVSSGVVKSFSSIDSLPQETQAIDWQRLGFELTVSGPKTLLLRKVPAFFKALPMDYESLLPTLLMQKTLELAIETIGKAGSQWPLTLGEAEKIVQELTTLGFLSSHKNSFMQFQLYRQLCVDDLRSVFF